MFHTWMNILQRVPKSGLWLLGGIKSLEENLIGEVKKAGIDPKRLIFSEKLPKENHLERIQLADLVLDTRIVNGAASTSDALWMKVPVVTLQGSHFASRMASSILQAMGLPELIAHTLKEYEEMAVAFASDPIAFQKIKTRLSNARETSPLFNTELSVKCLEVAYMEMWNRLLKGEKPNAIDVKKLMA